MNARPTRFFIASAALLLAGGIAGTASAATPSLCNADGKVEVLAHTSAITCDSSPEGEARALLKARTRYEGDSRLDWKERAIVTARIDRRVRELRREMRRARG
ncbi:MAG TPA: hypothetical protein VD846_10780 [Allosphingosinicella sp.]|nr:hypothetical protein [Allosphingosinicella sp.]